MKHIHLVCKNGCGREITGRGLTGMCHRCAQNFRNDRQGGGEIPTSVLARAFDASDTTLSEIAYAMGRIKSRRVKDKVYKYPDTTAIRRYMGRARDGGVKAKNRYRLRVTYKTAVKFVLACGHDPVDYGL